MAGARVTAPESKAVTLWRCRELPIAWSDCVYPVSPNWDEYRALPAADFDAILAENAAMREALREARDALDAVALKEGCGAGAGRWELAIRIDALLKGADK